MSMRPQCTSPDTDPWRQRHTQTAGHRPHTYRQSLLQRATRFRPVLAQEVCEWISLWLGRLDSSDAPGSHGPPRLPSCAQGTWPLLLLLWRLLSLLLRGSGRGRRVHAIGPGRPCSGQQSDILDSRGMLAVVAHAAQLSLDCFISIASNQPALTCSRASRSQKAAGKGVCSSQGWLRGGRGTVQRVQVDGWLCSSGLCRLRGLQALHGCEGICMARTSLTRQTSAYSNAGMRERAAQ